MRVANLKSLQILISRYENMPLAELQKRLQFKKRHTYIPLHNDMMFHAIRNERLTRREFYVLANINADLIRNGYRPIPSLILKA
jgi:hypothetical protein